MLNREGQKRSDTPCKYRYFRQTSWENTHSSSYVMKMIRIEYDFVTVTKEPKIYSRG